MGNFSLVAERMRRQCNHCGHGRSWPSVGTAIPTGPGLHYQLTIGAQPSEKQLVFHVADFRARIGGASIVDDELPEAQVGRCQPGVSQGGQHVIDSSGRSHGAEPTRKSSVATVRFRPPGAPQRFASANSVWMSWLSASAPLP